MIINKNKKAYHEYQIIEEFTAGIVLVGSELKPLVNNKVSIGESYCYIKDNEIFIKGMHIAEYELVGRYDTHNPTRVRKLLLNKKEIKDIQKKIEQKGMTIIPLNIHKNATGLIKMKIALAKGKKLHDKRQSIKSRDISIDINREIKNS